MKTKMKYCWVWVLLTALLFSGCGKDAVVSAEESRIMESFGVAVDTAEPTPEPTELQVPESVAEPEMESESEPETEWYLTLVNRDHPLPEDYEIDLTVLSNGTSVDSRIYPALQEMFDTAREEGVYPIVASGYRTWEDQERIMQEYIEDYQNEGYSYAEAEAEALEWVAIPGTSEHQLGFSVDINADGINSAGYEVYDWLAEHAWEYGFIKRYPEDKTEITGISNEPWHYRYVGVEAAKEISERGLCFEEYWEELFGE